MDLTIPNDDVSVLLTELYQAQNRVGRGALTRHELHDLRVRIRDGLLFWMKRCVVEGTEVSSRVLKTVTSTYTELQQDLRLEYLEELMDGQGGHMVPVQIYFEAPPPAVPVDPALN
jgi:type II secretory pathway predicted ATPase ExeA